MNRYFYLFEKYRLLVPLRKIILQCRNSFLQSFFFRRCRNPLLPPFFATFLAIKPPTTSACAVVFSNGREDYHDLPVVHGDTSGRWCGDDNGFFGRRIFWKKNGGHYRSESSIEKIGKARGTCCPSLPETFSVKRKCGPKTYSRKIKAAAGDLMYPKPPLPSLPPTS